MRNYKINGEFKGTISDLNACNNKADKAITRESEDAVGGDNSVVRTYDGDAVGGYDSVVRTTTGDASGGDNSVVRTYLGDASGGDNSAVWTKRGDVSVGSQSVGMGSDIDKIGNNSVVAIADPVTAEITKVVVKTTNRNLEIEVRE